MQVEQAMRDALHDQAKRAVNEYPREKEESIRREKWLWDYPAQVKLLPKEMWATKADHLTSRKAVPALR